MQTEDNFLTPVMFVIEKLKPNETRYPTIEPECLALVLAVKKVHMFLYGHEFVLQTAQAIIVP